MLLLGILCLIYLIWEENHDNKPIPRGNMDNTKLLGEDLDKVCWGKMSKKEFNANLYNGKYRLDDKE